MMRPGLVCALVIACVVVPQPGSGKAPAPLRDPRIVAAEILSNHRLYRLDGVPQQRPGGLLERAMGWTRRALERLLVPMLRGARFPAELLTRTGYLILAAGLVAILFSAMRIVLRLRGKAGTVHQSSPLPSSVNIAELYAQSCAASERGDYVTAFARLFKAALAALAEAGVLCPRPAATVGDYRSEVRSSNPLVLSAFEVIARGFTAAMYAELPVVAADWDEARAAYFALRERVAH